MKVHNVIRNHPLFEGYDKPIMDLIRDGRVRINGKRRRTNRDVIVHRDTIEVLLEDTWTILEPDIKRTVILMYKPVGYLCTHSDIHDRDIIYSLLPEMYRTLRSAGRLDLHSEGLLVLSDDGYFLFALTSPKLPCSKTYLVALEKELPEEMIEEAASGSFTIYRDGVAQVLRPVKINSLTGSVKEEFSFLNLEPQWTWYEFELTEGKYNQIRKMCLNYGLPVQRLIRIQHGKFRLNKQIQNEGFVIISTKED